MQIRIEYEHYSVKETPVWAKASWPDGAYIAGASGRTPVEARTNVLEKVRARLEASNNLPQPETVEVDL